MHKIVKTCLNHIAQYTYYNNDKMGRPMSTAEMMDVSISQPGSVHDAGVFTIQDVIGSDCYPLEDIALSLRTQIVNGYLPKGQK